MSTDEIVDMLWARDSRAYARVDWEEVADDFDGTAFIGCRADGGGDAPWRILCPDLDSYRDMWLASARTQLDALGNDTEALERQTLRTSRIAGVEVSGPWALVRKEFGEPGTTDSVVYYYLRNDGSRWRITSFVSGLPGSSS